MGETALRRQTVVDFLAWDPGDGGRYELNDGVPRAMAPPSTGHALVTNQIGRHLAAALAGSSCLVLSGAGVAPVAEGDELFIPDVVVSCRAHKGDEPWVRDPQVVVEVLSPSTESFDRRTKLPAYRSMESVQEVLLVDGASRFAEVHRRQPGGSWRVDLLRFAGDVIELASLEVQLELGLVYEGLDFPA